MTWGFTTEDDEGLVFLSESKPHTTVFHPLMSGLARSCLLARTDDAVVADDVGSDPVEKKLHCVDMSKF